MKTQRTIDLIWVLFDISSNSSSQLRKVMVFCEKL